MQDGQRAANPPVFAELQLIAKPREQRQVTPRILVRTRFRKGNAPLVIGQLVVKTQAWIELVIQVQAVDRFAIGVIGEPVYVQIVCAAIESVLRRSDLVQRGWGHVGAGLASPGLVVVDCCSCARCRQAEGNDSRLQNPQCTMEFDGDLASPGTADLRCRCVH